MAKKSIKAVIINPEALESASKRKTKVLFDIWWDLELKKQADERIIQGEKKLED